MSIDISPKYFLVNVAHTGLKLQAKGPCIRVVGAFRSNTQANLISKHMYKEYDLTCLKIKKGGIFVVPCSQSFITDPLYMPMRLDKIKEHHKEFVQQDHQEFIKHKKELQSKKNATDKLRYAQEQTKKMLAMRQADREASIKMMEEQSTGTGMPKQVHKKYKGVYNFFNVSFLKDPSGNREHAVQIHSVHRTEAEAEEHTSLLYKKQPDRRVHTLEMYQWIHVDMAFCEHLMEKVKQKYGEKIKNDIMQFHLVEKNKRKEDILCRQKTVGGSGTHASVVPTIEPDLPDLTLQPATASADKQTEDVSRVVEPETPAPPEGDDTGTVAPQQTSEEAITTGATTTTTS